MSKNRLKESPKVLGLDVSTRTIGWALFDIQTKELLELIKDCLKPKVIEKKKYGEVFTPLKFINEKMLKDIAHNFNR